VAKHRATCQLLSESFRPLSTAGIDGEIHLRPLPREMHHKIRIADTKVTPLLRQKGQYPIVTALKTMAARRCDQLVVPKIF
jgi:hypothetical protein